MSGGHEVTVTREAPLCDPRLAALPRTGWAEGGACTAGRGSVAYDQGKTSWFELRT